MEEYKQDGFRVMIPKEIRIHLDVAALLINSAGGWCVLIDEVGGKYPGVPTQTIEVIQGQRLGHLGNE